MRAAHSSGHGEKHREEVRKSRKIADRHARSSLLRLFPGAGPTPCVLEARRLARRCHPGLLHLTSSRWLLQRDVTALTGARFEAAAVPPPHAERWRVMGGEDGERERKSES